MPWRNGAGVTTEVAINAGGGLQGFDWRVSIADVGQDGPFSAFPGMQRIIAVLEGAGMELTVDGRKHALQGPGQPYAFSGDSQVESRLLNGPIRDFNLIYAPQRYQARLQWLQGSARYEFHSSAPLVLVFNAGQALQVTVNKQTSELAEHDSLQVEAADLTAYGLQAEAGVNACVIELQAIA